MEKKIKQLLEWLNNDLAVLKREAVDSLTDREVFQGKIYSDFSFRGKKQQEQQITLLTPLKAIKAEDTIITQREKAGRGLVKYSSGISALYLKNGAETI